LLDVNLTFPLFIMNFCASARLFIFKRRNCRDWPLFKGFQRAINNAVMQCHLGFSSKVDLPRQDGV
jgi:hypothetical protein